MKKYILLTMGLFGVLIAKGQQDAMYTQYMFNTLAVNPAYAGSRNVMSITGLYRSQWVGVDGAPTTQTLSFDAAIPNKRVGIGAQVFNDEIGVTKTTGAYFSYAYRIPTGKGSLALGLQGGLAQLRVNFSSVDLGGTNPTDVAFMNNINEVLPNFGAGVYYNTDRFYMGVSMPHLLNNRLTDENSPVVSNGLVARQYLHLFVASGYVVDLGDDFKLKPSFLFKGVMGAPMQLDLNLNLWIKDRIAIGSQYRTGDAIAFMGEIQVSDQFRVGYSYDKTVSQLANYNSGSHEIMARFEFGFQKSRIVAPRYF